MTGPEDVGAAHRGSVLPAQGPVSGTGLGARAGRARLGVLRERSARGPEPGGQRPSAFAAASIAARDRRAWLRSVVYQKSGSEARR